MSLTKEYEMLEKLLLGSLPRIQQCSRIAAGLLDATLRLWTTEGHSVIGGALVLPWVMVLIEVPVLQYLMTASAREMPGS